MPDGDDGLAGWRRVAHRPDERVRGRPGGELLGHPHARAELSGDEAAGLEGAEQRAREDEVDPCPFPAQTPAELTSLLAAVRSQGAELVGPTGRGLRMADEEDLHSATEDSRAPRRDRAPAAVGARPLGYDRLARQAAMDPTFLTRLGVPWLWGADVEKGWLFMRYNVVPVTALLLAPRSRGYGLERMPLEGGGVVASNHLSALDPPFVGSFSRRTIFYMMKTELLDIPVVGEALTWTGGFPIRRGESDREGLRKACEIVRAGHLVGVFVEGTRQRFGYPGPVHSGALTIAMKESVPVIPVGLETFGWTRKNRRRCCMVIGEPMRFDDLPRNGSGYREAAELLRLEILRLWRQAAEAVAAGLPPELPDGTPRAGWVKPWQFHRLKGKPRRVSGLV